VTEDTSLSKRPSFWLRHRPDAAGLVLDDEGWTDVDAVLAALARQGTGGGLDRLRGMVERNDKQRFELTLDESRIRARQGHSVAVDLDWPVQVPPDLLYHGTVKRFLPAILQEGLRPMKRHYVHLSPDIATAARVGARRGAPVVLAVSALRLHRSGTPLLLTGNQVWLTAAVPPGFIEVVRMPSAADC
jgi:putative RNA 2'-phosphotransferase